MLRGGDYDRWDLEVRGGPLGAARARMGVEEHGAGKQLLRFRLWPKVSGLGLVLTLIFATLAVAAAIDGAVPGMAILGLGAGALLGRELQECGAGMAAFIQAIEPLDEDGAADPETAKGS